MKVGSCQLASLQRSRLLNLLFQSYFLYLFVLKLSCHYLFEQASFNAVHDINVIF